MDFSKALEAMKAGKKIKKLGWNKTHIIFESPDVFYRVYPSGLKEDWYFGNNDILAEDWEIVEDIPKVQLRASEMFFCPNCRQPNHGPFIENTNGTCKYCGQVVKLLPKDEPKPKYKQPEFVLTKLDFGYGLLYVPGINQIVKELTLQQGIEYPETKEEALNILDELSTFRVPISDLPAFKECVNHRTSKTARQEDKAVHDSWLRFF